MLHYAPQIFDGVEICADWWPRQRADGKVLKEGGHSASGVNGTPVMLQQVAAILEWSLQGVGHQHILEQPAVGRRSEGAINSKKRTEFVLADGSPYAAGASAAREGAVAVAWLVSGEI